MDDSSPEVDALFLPNQYGSWTLDAFNYGDDDHITTFTYVRAIDEQNQFSVFVEEDGDEFGGALLDIGEPENPHRDPIDTFEADDIEEALQKAKAFMDRDLSKYYR